MKKDLRKLITFDCETDPFLRGRVPSPFVWGAYDGDEVHYFYDTQQFALWLRAQDAVAYAHNGGKFDMHFLTDYIDNGTRPLVINGRIAKMEFGACELRDSWCIFNQALSAYKKDDMDYAKLEKNRRADHKREIEQYLAGDVKYLYELIEAFWREYGRGLTLAGTAFKIFHKMRGLKKPAHPDGKWASKAYFEKISAYYYGGRVEAFTVGMINRKVTMSDVHSAYPYAMLHEHASSFDATTRKCLPSDPVVLQSMYTVDALSKGALPMREKSGLTFPIGRNIYKCTGWELQAGLDTGTIVIYGVKSRLDFNRTINFKDYVDKFYKIKESSKKGTPEYLFAKILLNACYGKYGSNPTDYREFCLVHPDQMDAECLALKKSGDANDWHCAGQFGSKGVISKKVEVTDMTFFNAATAASITGFQRAHLWRAICEARTSGEVLYCDTDSLVFSGDAKLDYGPEVGKWGIDGTFKEGAICAKKLYALKCMELNKEGKVEWKIASKGARLTHMDIMDIARGKVVEYQADAPTFSLIKSPVFMSRRLSLKSVKEKHALEQRMKRRIKPPAKIR